MQIAEAGLKLNLNIFLDDWSQMLQMNGKSWVLPSSSFSGRSWNEFFKATAGIYVCLLPLYKK